MLNFSGYAEVNREFIKGLCKKGIKVNAVMPSYNVDKNFRLSGEDKIIINKSLLNKQNPEYPMIQHVIAEDLRVYKAYPRNIPIVIFETIGMPRHWVNIMNDYPLILTMTDWGKKQFKESGVKSDIKVIHEGVDTEKFNPAKIKPLPGIKDKNKYTFYWIAQFTVRKAYDVLFKAYISEFDQKESVELICKSYIDGRPQEIDYMAQIVQNIGTSLGKLKVPSIKFHTKPLGLTVMPRFHASCDCLVNPSRSEGWSLPATEAMAMAKPTILSNCSGHTEYANDKNSYLVKIDGISSCYDMDWISRAYQNLHWYEPSIEDLRKKMRWVFEHQKEAEEKGKRARQDMISHFQWHHAAENIIKEVS